MLLCGNWLRYPALHCFPLWSSTTYTGDGSLLPILRGIKKWNTFGGGKKEQAGVVIKSRNKGNISVYRLEPAYFLLECCRYRSIQWKMAIQITWGSDHKCICRDRCKCCINALCSLQLWLNYHYDRGTTHWAYEMSLNISCSAV